MKYGTVAYVGKPVSRIVFGCAISPVVLSKDGNEIFDSAWQAGINTFDLARNYVASEMHFGNWLEKRGVRDRAVILSKCGHPSLFGRARLTKQDILNDFSRSTRQLKTDYIDIYLLHRDDESQDVSVAVEIMNELHAAGKIGAFGGSNWKHTRIEEANEYAYKHGLVPFSVSSPNFGLAEQVNDPWGGCCVSISGVQNASARKWYLDHSIAIFAYSALGRGLFSGKLHSNDLGNLGSVLDQAAQRGYCSEENFERLRRCEIIAERHGATVPQVALAWIFTQGLDVFAVVSATAKERILSNVASLDLQLSSQEAEYLDLRRASV